MTTKRRLHRPIKRNLKILPFVYFFTYLLPYAPIGVILFEKLAGSYLQAMSVFTVMGLASALLEVPTGVLSDKWGRRKTMVVGGLLSLINVVMLLGACYSEHVMWFLYAAAIFQGGAEALYSGNNEALVYETLAALKRTHTYPKFFGQMNSMMQAGLAVSGMTGGLVLLSGLPSVALFYVSLGTSFCLVALSCLLVEPPEKLVTDTHPFKHIRTAFHEIKKNKKLAYYSLTNMIQMGAMNANYYFTPGFIGSVWPTWAAAIFRTAQHGIGSFGFLFAHYVIKRFGPVRSMIGVPLLSNGISMIAYWLQNAFSPLLIASAQFSFSTWKTAKSTIEQESFTKEQRATMGSLISFGSSIVSGLLSLLMGWMGDHLSLGLTMFIVVAVRSVFVNSSYAFIYRRYK
ncbi:MAG: MFS transporter [Bdellovibrionales bacterium]